MTHGWEDQFKQLKSQFLVRSQERLLAVESLLKELQTNPTDEHVLKQIMQHYHWLAGSGGTYGYDDVSQWGTYGEELCDYLIKVGGPVGSDHQEKLYGALQTIRQLFATKAQLPPQSGVPGSADPQTAVIQDRPPNTDNVDTAILSHPTKMASSVSVPPRALNTTEYAAMIPPDKPYAVVVNGDLTNLGLWKQELESRGFHVESFSTAHAALPSICDHVPDVLLVSVPLPDSLGYELSEQLRAIDGGQRSVVVILGHQAGFLDKVQSIRSGADAFFEYPCDHTEVMNKIFYLLDKDKPQQYKILSVEDDPDQANFIKLTLESAGYRLMQVADPHRFEEAFLSFEPDLVLMDVMLGDINGFELAKYIRQYDRFAAVPIIFLTTQNKVHMHIKGARAGGDEHLVKPVSPQLLTATIAGRLEKFRALKRLIDRCGLTRCLTFGTFMEKVQKMAHSEAWRQSPALMLLDVDNMKVVNDNYGFASGDKVLANIGALLLKGFRNTDMIARWGHDRFAVIIEHLNEQQLGSLASQVVGAIAQTPHPVQGGAIAVTASAGLACLEEGMTLQQWIQNAERALTAAKQQGKNQAMVMPRVSSTAP